MAANYIVGGPNGGWDTTTGLQTWASSQSFSVGDNLMIFDYDSCQASNAIQSYNGGTTTTPVSSPGKRYFISFSPSNCPTLPEDNDGIFSVILEEDNDGIFIPRSGSCLSCGK